MRRPLGTYFARPSGHDSLSKTASLKNVLLYFWGMVADSICCQILWCHSLASVEEAARTNNGELTRAVAPSMGNGEILASVSIFRAVVFEGGQDARGDVINCFVDHHGDVDAGQLVNGTALVKSLFSVEARATE